MTDLRPSTSATAKTTKSIGTTFTNKSIQSKKAEGYPKFDIIRGYSRHIITESIRPGDQFNETERELIAKLRSIANLQLSLDQETLSVVNVTWPNLSMFKSVQNGTSPPLHDKISNIGLLQYIVDTTSKCVNGKDKETGWNSFVHGTVLNIASQ
jgi:hypothetical protein